MAVAEDEWREIERLLSDPAIDGGAAVAALRGRFPRLSWTRCDASDLTETPFRRCGGFDIHLLDGADHCARITADPGAATGLILARRRNAS